MSGASPERCWPGTTGRLLTRDNFSSAGVVTGEAALAKSKAVPGVLGVFVEEPKEANAPEPRPKADDAPGEAIAAVFNGEAPFDVLDRAELSAAGNRRAPSECLGCDSLVSVLLRLELGLN